MDISALLDKVVSATKDIRGIDAIVLGGSRATGTATAASDVDIGIYYGLDFDVEAFKNAARELDDERRPDCITDIGQWGPWINGGGWLKIDGIAVDLLFRDTAKVERCMEACIGGDIAIYYQCGHPFGFVTSIYMGEVYSCRILHASNLKIDSLKRRLVDFSPIYKSAAINKFLWESEFSLMCGRKSIYNGDVIYASGSLFRSAVCLIQALFAFNELYCINEKGSLNRLIANSAVLPDGFASVLEGAMAANSDNLNQCFDEMCAMHESVKLLCQSR